MKTVNVRGITIGEGIPKICAPVLGKTEEEILLSAERVKASSSELAEWRADWYEDGSDGEKIKKILKDLRNTLGNVPLLFTFRTKKEGGEMEISEGDYVRLNKLAASSGYVDLIDVEVFSKEELVKELIDYAHEYGVKVIGSYHDFYKTPQTEEILERLIQIQDTGSDICKLAVTPRSRADVFTLISATEEMTSKFANRPVITMSMGGEGVISRLCGEISGSAVTFGAAGQVSAPGQLMVERLREALQILHESMY